MKKFGQICTALLLSSMVGCGPKAQSTPSTTSSRDLSTCVTGGYWCHDHARCERDLPGPNNPHQWLP
jgi:hypothetical protein